MTFTDETDFRSRVDTAIKSADLAGILADTHSVYVDGGTPTDTFTTSLDPDKLKELQKYLEDARNFVKEMGAIKTKDQFEDAINKAIRSGDTKWFFDKAKIHDGTTGNINFNPAITDPAIINELNEKWTNARAYVLLQKQFDDQFEKTVSGSIEDDISKYEANLKNDDLSVNDFKTLLDNLNRLGNPTGILKDLEDKIDSLGNAADKIGISKNIIETACKKRVSELKYRIAELKQRTAMKYNSKIRLVKTELRSVIEKCTDDAKKNAIKANFETFLTAIGESATWVYNGDNLWDKIRNTFPEVGSIDNIKFDTNIINEIKFDETKMSALEKFIKDSAHAVGNSLFETDTDPHRKETFIKYTNAKIAELKDRIDKFDASKPQGRDAIANAIQSLMALIDSSTLINTSERTAFKTRLEELKKDKKLEINSKPLEQIIHCERRLAFFEEYIYDDESFSDVTTIREAITKNVAEVDAIDLSVISDKNEKKKLQDRIDAIKDRYKFLSDYADKKNDTNLNVVENNIDRIKYDVPTCDKKTNSNWRKNYKKTKKEIDTTRKMIRKKRNLIKNSDMSDAEKEAALNKLKEYEEDLDRQNNLMMKNVPFLVRTVRKAGTFFKKHPWIKVVGIGLATTFAVFTAGVAITSLASPTLPFGVLLTKALSNVGLAGLMKPFGLSFINGYVVKSGAGWAINTAVTHALKSIAIGSIAAGTVGVPLATLMVNKLRSIIGKEKRKKKKNKNKRNETIEEIIESEKSERGGRGYSKGEDMKNLEQIAKVLVERKWNLDDSADMKKVQKEFALSDDELNIVIDYARLQKGKRR